MSASPGQLDPSACIPIRLRRLAEHVGVVVAEVILRGAAVDMDGSRED